MKTTILLTILFFFNTIFAQVDFNYDFSLIKVNPQDELVRVWIDDIDGDGVDEIYAGYKYSYNLTNTYEWRVITYNLNGEIISVFEQLNDNPIFLKNCTTFKTDSSAYLITALNRTDSSSGSNQYYLDVEIYDFSSHEIIDVISIYIDDYNPISGTRVLKINYIVPTNTQDTIVINIGITKRDYYYFSDDEDEHTDYTELLKFSFNNELLELIESIDDCGNTFNKFDNYETIITTGNFNYSYYWLSQGIFEASKKIYLNLISQSNPTQITNILNVEGEYYGPFENYPANISILSKNDVSNVDYGFAIYFKIFDSNLGDTNHFINYSSDFSDSVWYSQSSNLTLSQEESIISTCISVNYEDHYIMYFYDDQLEIRDRIDGDIIHHQTTFIDPFSILRKSDMELFFITESVNEFFVYTLSEEIQVSAKDNQISITNYNLHNYPNPFNPTTTIEFSIQNDSKVELSIYNIKGQKIRTLVNNDYNQGAHSVLWNGDDEFCNSASSGIYYYKLNINDKIEVVKKCLLLK